VSEALVKDTQRLARPNWDQTVLTALPCHRTIVDNSIA
jgi:hypothetical protein